MKLFISILFILLTIGTCQARTFGCFMGVIGAGSDHSVEVDYNHYQIFSRTKHTSEFLPFLGCGISFDF